MMTSKSKKINLNGTMDAQIWTEEWMKTIAKHPKIPTDEGTMLSWFANAIMAGYDQGQRDIKAEITEETSDGYHTFNELYEHRHTLFIALMLAYPEMSWRARYNSDGGHYDGWFIAGMHLPTGDISYHLPLELLGRLDYSGIETSMRAPEWDGHTSEDVIQRLKTWRQK